MSASSSQQADVNNVAPNDSSIHKAKALLAFSALEMIRSGRFREGPEADLTRTGGACEVAHIIVP